MKKKQNDREVLSEVENVIKKSSKDYIEENLWYFIQKETVSTRVKIGSCWRIESDEKTNLRILVLDYIVPRFSLRELSLIFNPIQSCYPLTEDTIRESRKIAIESINDDQSLTGLAKKRLKRKVWDMNYILFGLILELVIQSEIFFDSETEEFFIPDFAA